ncbi:partial, partial [Paramuricea clavata]
MVASLAAIGISAGELEEFLDQDVRKIMADHSCGYCSLLPNLKKGFGWNPGKKLNNWFGEQLRERTGDYDITFKDILRLFGTEICIVVTNLSHMSVEYFHPKTTPNIPVRKAVKMSMALPGVFQVVRETFNGQEDVYVDGGLLCNYPIHAFD